MMNPKNFDADKVIKARLKLQVGEVVGYEKKENYYWKKAQDLRLKIQKELGIDYQGWMQLIRELKIK